MTTTIDHEIEIENAYNVEVLVMPYDPDFKDQSWELDQGGNMMAYKVNLELEWDEYNYFETITNIVAVDAEANEVTHTNINDVNRVKDYISKIDLGEAVEDFYSRG